MKVTQRPMHLEESNHFHHHWHRPSPPTLVKPTQKLSAFNLVYRVRRGSRCYEPTFMLIISCKVGSASGPGVTAAASSSPSGVGGRVIDALLHPHHKPHRNNQQRDRVQKTIADAGLLHRSWQPKTTRAGEELHSHDPSESSRRPPSRPEASPPPPAAASLKRLLASLGYL